MNFLGFLGFSQFYPPKPFTQFFPGKYHLVFPMVNTTLANPVSGQFLSRISVEDIAYPRPTFEVPQLSLFSGKLMDWDFRPICLQIYMRSPPLTPKAR